jgi:hypothetical protein
LVGEECRLGDTDTHGYGVKNMLKNYAAVVNPGGSITLDSIAPGQYTLKVTAH